MKDWEFNFYFPRFISIVVNSFSGLNEINTVAMKFNDMYICYFYVIIIDNIPSFTLTSNAITDRN